MVSEGFNHQSYLYTLFEVLHSFNASGSRFSSDTLNTSPMLSLTLLLRTPLCIAKPDKLMKHKDVQPGDWMASWLFFAFKNSDPIRS